MATNNQFISVNISVKKEDAQRLFRTFEKLPRNIKEGCRTVSESTLNTIAAEGRRIIESQTTGFGQGKLKNSFSVVIKQFDNALGAELKIVDAEARRYGFYVHEGFQPHWVSTRNNPNLVAWMESANFKKIPGRVFVNPPWARGGMKFFEIPFRNNLGKAGEEFSKAVEKAISDSIHK